MQCSVYFGHEEIKAIIQGVVTARRKHGRYAEEPPKSPSNLQFILTLTATLKEDVQTWGNILHTFS